MEHKSTWSTIFGLCLVAFFILGFIIMSMEDGSSYAGIVGILYLIDIVLGIISIVKFNQEEAKNKTVDEYLKSSREEMKQRRDAIQESKKPKINSEGKVTCPRCGSTNIQIVKRGWKITTGFIGSGKNERVCINCMKKF